MLLLLYRVLNKIMGAEEKEGDLHVIEDEAEQAHANKQSLNTPYSQNSKK